MSEMTKQTGAMRNGAGREPTRDLPRYQPLVDILEKDEELLLLADLPGVSPDSVDIQFEDGALTLSGRVQDRRPGEARAILREYGVGDWHRTFTVSETIDASKIHAEYRDGVLALHLPKVEAAQPRKIPVKSA